MISVNNTDLITLRVTLLGLAHICRLSIDKVCDGINNIYFLVVVFIFHRKFYNLLKSVPSQMTSLYSYVIYLLPFSNVYFTCADLKERGDGPNPWKIQIY